MVHCLQSLFLTVSVCLCVCLSGPAVCLSVSFINVPVLTLSAPLLCLCLVYDPAVPLSCLMHTRVNFTLSLFLSLASLCDQLCFSSSTFPSGIWPSSLSLLFIVQLFPSPSLSYTLQLFCSLSLSLAHIFRHTSLQPNLHGTLDCSKLLSIADTHEVHSEPFIGPDFPVLQMS